VSYDFVSERTHDGRPLKILTLIDEYSRECLALLVERCITSDDVLTCLGSVYPPRDTGTHSFRQRARVHGQGGPGSGWGILG